MVTCYNVCLAARWTCLRRALSGFKRVLKQGGSAMFSGVFLCSSQDFEYHANLPPLLLVLLRTLQFVRAVPYCMQDASCAADACIPSDALPRLAGPPCEALSSQQASSLGKCSIQSIM